MVSRHIIFEWREGEDAYADALAYLDAPPLSALGALSLPDEEAKAIFYLGRFLVPILALLLTAAHAVPPGYVEELAAQKGVHTSIVLENRARKANDEQLFASLLEERSDTNLTRELMQLWQNSSADERAHVHMEIVDVKMNGGLALAKLLITQASDYGAPLLYHQYRFYRQVDGQWLRTFPHKSYWGESQLLHTAHLRFEFRSRDAEVVLQAAPRLDDIYVSLYAAMGMKPPAQNEKLTIRVMERDRPGWTVNEDRLNVPSYMVTVADPKMDDVAAFSQAIISNLTFQVLRESQTARGGNRFVLWSALFPGLHNWLTKEQSSHPLLWESLMASALQRQLAEQPTLSLNGVSYSSGSGRNPWQWRTLALESIVDYVVTQYGRDRLPEFVEALSVHNSWSTLIPALYNVSVAEFEAGWNRHLTQKYR